MTGTLVAAALAGACGPDHGPDLPPADSAAVAAMLPVNRPVVLSTPTYEGSGQTVHPDFAGSRSWWEEGKSSFLALTPYPGGDVRKENPTILRSVDPLHWGPIPGAPNPIVQTTEGYLSDPDILFDPGTRQLLLYYRAVHAMNVIRLVRSSDGREWSAPIEVVRAPNHTVVSPAVVRRHRQGWFMWSVNAGEGGCTSTEPTTVELRTSADGLAWSEPRTVSLPSPRPGYTPWHIEVQWVPSRGEYWALYNAKTRGGCGTTVLYLATSTDGEHWTSYPEPVLVAGELPALGQVVYRSTFDYDAKSDVITFWFSGASFVGTSSTELAWHTVVQRKLRSDVFSRISTASPGRIIPRQARLVRPP